jgi:hypothetical protein
MKTHGDIPYKAVGIKSAYARPALTVVVVRLAGGDELVGGEQVPVGIVGRAPHETPPTGARLFGWGRIA